RSGRSSSKKGEVIIQTSHSENEAIQATMLNSYKMFFNYELNHRATANYPPFYSFSIIEFTGKRESDVIRNSNGFVRYLPKNNDSLIICGPTEPSIPRLRKNYRRIITVRADKQKDPSGNKMKYYLKYALKFYEKNFSTSNVKMTIDIDSFASL
nr:hypothetical protein [Candidatus Kapabacteria bacterium]